jgi:hypothetical protein
MQRTEIVSIVEAVDVEAAKRADRALFPHLPGNLSDQDWLVVLHHARTQMNSVRFRLRAYSHCWLLDRGLPSGLPDGLRPAAQRLYPRVVEGVGVAVLSKLPVVASGIRNAMSTAAAEVYGDMPEGKNPDPVIVRRQMLHARERQRKYFSDLLKLRG